MTNYLADLRAFLRWSREAQDGSSLQLDVPDIEAYCSYLRDTKNHAPATVNRRLQSLRKFYGLAVAKGWVSENPAEEVSLMGETVSERSRFLDTADVERLLTAVKKGRPRWVARDWAVFQVFLGAGLKLGEMIQLRLGDVHLDTNSPHLVIPGTSGGSTREIPLEADVRDALHAYLAKRRAAAGVDHLFVNRDGRALSTRSVQRLLHHYASAAGIDGLTSQALRYQYAKMVYQRTGDLEAVARRLGHRHLATTIRYLRPVLSNQEVAQPQPPQRGPQDSGSSGNAIES